LICLSMMTAAGQGFARSSPNFTPQESTLSDKELEQVLAEVEHLRKVRKLNDEEKAALREQLKAYEALLATERERIAALKSANAIDDKRVALYEKSLSDYKSQVDRLTRERDRARSALKFVGAVAFAIGGALGFLVAK
jgi:chromosome segregation ATPase